MDLNELEIEYIPITEIKPNPRNAKKHPKEQINTLKASLSEFKLCRPLGIRGSSNQLVYGHGTLQALIALEYKGKIPCVRLDHLTDEQCRAYALADNRTAELGEWDSILLGEELATLAGFGMAQFGFEDFEEKTEVHEDDYDVKLPEAPKTKRGDIYQLGDHRLICGDSTCAEDIESLMDGATADLLVTDPPYNVDYEGATEDKLKMQNDHMSEDDYVSFLNSAFECINKVLKPGGAFYIWHADTHTMSVRQALANVGLSVRECLIWVKNTFVLGRQDYQWQHEPCLYGWKEGVAHYFTKKRNKSTVLNVDKPTRNAEHPTMKPVLLLSPLIENSTRSGEIVLDMFGGSGSTLIACEQLKRKCYTVEYDPKFCDVIVDRWEKLTGKKAIKVVPNDGGRNG